MTSTYNRRQFLGQSAAVAGGVVAAGAAAELADAAPAGAVTKGGTLYVGLIAEQSKPFNPDFAHMDTTGFNYARLIYDPLMVVSSNGKSVYPYLAESLTHDGTYKNWTIKVRKGVKFHNGDVCDANAIYQNLKAVLGSYLTGPAVASLISGFTLNESAGTVVVHTKYKWTTFPYTLAEQQIGFIAHPSTLGSTYSGDPIGTGPFVFDAWDYNTSFSAKANTQYWRPGFPYLAEVVLMPIPDSTSRLEALTGNNVDLVIEAEGPAIHSMKQGSFLSNYSTFFDGPTGTPVWAPSCNCIMLNCSKPPFTNATLRKACAMAIDQSLYVSVVDDGESAPINGIFLPNSPYYKKPPYPAYNKTAAKNLVKGLSSSLKSFLILYVSGDPTIQNAAEFVQGQLQDVGLNPSIQGVSQAQLIDAAVSGSVKVGSTTYPFQAMTWSQFGGVSPDLNYPWFSTKAKNSLVNLNFARMNDSKLQNLMIQAFGATSNSARDKAWAAVNTEIDTDIPYLWTDRTVLGIGASKSVQGWKAATAPGGQAVLCPNQGVFFYHQIWKS